MENIQNLSGKIFVVRHAESLYNSAKYDDELFEIRDTDKRFIDA